MTLEFSYIAFMLLFAAIKDTATPQKKKKQPKNSDAILYANETKTTKEIMCRCFPHETKLFIRSFL